MKLKKTMALVASIFALCACSSRHFENHNHDTDTQASSKAFVHGMIVFGTNTVYASHIPMFRAPHAIQALFEIELSHAKLDVKSIYQKQNTSEKQPLISIKPAPFSLPDLLNGKISSFKVSLFTGNYEQGGKLLLSDVKVTVKKVIYANPLSTKTKPLSKLTYFVLKDRQDVYLVHRMTAPVNFDQIIQVRSSIPAENLPFEIEIEGRKDIVGEKLSDKSVVNILNPEATISGVNKFYCLVGIEFTKNCP